jgi:hypothetical protein
MLRQVAALPRSGWQPSRGMGGRFQWNTHAAGLIGRFDTLACKVLGARHVGLLGRDEAEKTLHQGGRRVRRALQAGEAMGEIPDEVLSGTRRAPHAPTVASVRPGAVTDAVRLRSLPDEG